MFRFRGGFVFLSPISSFTKFLCSVWIYSTPVACAAVCSIIRCHIQHRSWAVQTGHSGRPHVTPTISHALFPNPLTAHSTQDSNSQAVLSNLVKSLLESRHLSYHIVFQIRCHFNYSLTAVMSSPWPPFPSPSFLALPGNVYEPWRWFLDP